MLTAMCCFAPALAAAQEVEPNDSFDSAQVVHAGPAGEVLLDAGLQYIPFEPLQNIRFDFYTIQPGEVNRHDVTGWPAGAPVAAYIDNAVGPIEPDTVMRGLDEFGNEIEFQDDGSPLGNRYASGFLTTANADGTLHLEVTGYADYNFDGIDDLTEVPHQVSGEYALVLKPGPFGDVDFFRFVGLEPGRLWSAETLLPPGSLPLDTMLTQYDAAGQWVAQSNDRDPAHGDELSALAGIVPASGEVVLATTAFNDWTNVGAHLRSGDYGLRFVCRPVPEADTLTLVSISILAIPLARPIARKVALD